MAILFVFFWHSLDDVSTKENKSGLRLWYQKKYGQSGDMAICECHWGQYASFFLGIVLFIIDVLSYFFSPAEAPIISLFVSLAGIGIGIVWCEMLLNKHFDKNGKQKDNTKA